MSIILSSKVCYAGKPTESVVIVKKKGKSNSYYTEVVFHFFFGWAIRKSLVSPAATLRVVATRWLQLVSHKPQTDMPPPPPPLNFVFRIVFNISGTRNRPTIKKMLTKILKRKLRCIMGDLRKHNAWFRNFQKVLHRLGLCDNFLKQ